MTDPLVLASASPRRRVLLEMLGIAHDVAPTAIDETRESGEDAAAYAVRLARAKAVAGSTEHPGRWVLGADTIVVAGEEVLEKPADEPEAVTMLRQLAGRDHRVVTAVALACDGAVFDRTDVTRVWFRALTDEMIRAYVATGEPFDKAGGYGIQGYGAALVARIEGDYFSVMGLPVVKVLELLEEAGRPYTFTR